MRWLVRILARKTIRNFWEMPAYADSKRPLENWFAIAKHADWASPHDIKRLFGDASIIGSNRVVFNIAGNKYRLVLHFDYARRTGFIRFIGTHAQYDAIDAETI